ncbi:MAG: PAS domain S-box protein [Bacteroidales bacterium]|nr:PAS domain S-box protein [Bacteroidales bacterium]
MNSETSLVSVVGVDETLCVNCHMCISVCPVKYCNDGSGDIVQINPDTCIGCGKCIEACTHNARFFIDDFENFTNDLIAGRKIVAVSAPSSAASFPNAHLKLNSFLKELGVSAVFDVSFGAELTIKSYLEHIKNDNPKTVIAQPCPAIVSYIELYKPELIQHLAPVDSPILHTIKMIKKYYPDFKDHKIAIVSPCIAKKREYQATGLGDYNLGIQSIDKFLQTNNIDLSSYPDEDFDNPSAERAVLFSSPGGLTKTLERWVPGIECQTRRIEGVEQIYKYLDKLPQIIEDGKAPLIIDCLSCENGCNQGPVTLTKHQSPDESEYWVRKRAQDLRQKYLQENENNQKKSSKSFEELISKYWNSDFYDRKYTNRWENVNISYPTEDEISDIYHKMHKTNSEDILNCSSCGYNSCEGMAIAIHNKLNRPENCHHYLKKQSNINLVEAENSREKVEAVLHTAQDGFVEINKDEIIVAANDSMRRILKKKDIIGKCIFDFVDQKYKDLIETETKQRKGGAHSSYEVEFIQSDGQKVCCLISASPMYDFKTRTIIGSFAMVSDISKLKETERQLRIANDRLEQKVLDRTAKLNEALEELQQQKEEILAQKDALSDSEEKINNILRILPEPAFVINENGCVSFWNNAIEKMTGIKAKSIIGKGDYEYAIPFYGKKRPILIDLVRLDDGILNEKYQNIEKNGTTLKAETYVPNLLGQERYLIGNATAIYDQKGNYLGAIEVITDITDIKRKEEQIESQKKELFQKSVEMSEIMEELSVRNEIIESINEELSQLSIVASETDNAVVIMDEKGKIEWINKAFTNIYGYSLNDLFKNKGDTIFTTSSYDKIETVFDYVRDNKKSITYTSIEQDINNNKIYTQTSLSPVLDLDNNITNYVAVNSDITKIKKTEEILRNKQEEILAQKDEIEESSKKIHQIIQSLPDAGFVINASGEVEFWNEAMEKLTGIKAENILGKGNYEYAIPLYGKRKPLLINFFNLDKESFEKEYKAIKINKNIIQAETYAPKLPGGGKHLIGTASAIYDKDGKYNGAIEIIHNITQMKEYMQKIEIQRKDILASIKYAKNIQEAVFPPLSFVSEIIHDYFILFRPRDIISGDFYWSTIKDNILIVAIADCTGHGVPGALMSMLGISLLNEIVNGNNVTEPNEILNLLRSQVIKALRQDENKDSRDGMDISIISFNIDNNILEYSGAHNPLVFIRNDEFIVLKGDKMPISAQYNTSKPFSLQTSKVEKGDIFYMFSDGYSDQLNQEYRKLMRKSFYNLLLNIHKLPFEEQKTILDTNLNEWKKENSQTDDILVMGFSLDYYLNFK